VVQTVDPDILGGGGAQAVVKRPRVGTNADSSLGSHRRAKPRRVLVPTGGGWVGYTRRRRRRDSGLTDPTVV
jgi:hypothetical protein